MYGLTAVAVLQVALLATGESEYQKAYNQAERAGKPLLVLVGDDACPNCRMMKQETMPELIRSGELNDVVFTELNAEAKPELTQQFVRGDTLPQLVLYTPVGKLWRRTHISGVQSEAEIHKFLTREIAKGLEVAAQARQKKATTSNVIYTYSTGSS